MDVPVFAEMEVEKPALESLRAELVEVERAFDAARDAEGRRRALGRWDGLRARVWTWSSLVGLRSNQDTTDPARKEAREYRDALTPAWVELQNGFKRKLLASPHRAELEAAFGPQAFALWAQDARAHAPELEAHSVAISRLGAEYTELLASARLEVAGEQLTLSGLGKHASSPDRPTRHEAQRAKWGWFHDQAERLDDVFDRLVRLRHESAKTLGLSDFVELGYLRMHRVDYDRADVEGLRAQVREEVVPLCAELVRRQAVELGIPKVMLWDEGILAREGNPKPLGGPAWMVARAQEIFDAMGHGLGPFFRLLVEKGLLDLEGRPGKAGGGFCTSFPLWGVPFVFANFNGTKGDAEVLTHEMGHAFQSYSSRTQPLLDYRSPTHESAEIHSMSLEFLSGPWMDRFFGPEAERFRRTHLTGSLLFLPYGTAVDHFQHLLYERPGASPAERHAMWREMERTYLPWRDHGGLPHVGAGGFWQHQRHVYLYPFYYVDYVLAQVCALQFWVRADEDRPAAMADYVRLCARGGEAPFRELVRGAGLSSPFEAGCLASVVGKARDVLAR